MYGIYRRLQYFSHKIVKLNCFHVVVVLTYMSHSLHETRCIRLARHEERFEISSHLRKRKLATLKDFLLGMSPGTY